MTTETKDLDVDLAAVADRLVLMADVFSVSDPRAAERLKVAAAQLYTETVRELREHRS